MFILVIQLTRVLECMNLLTRESLLCISSCSDLIIKINGKEIFGHRFVLAARSNHWGVDDLSQVAILDLSGKTELGQFFESSDGFYNFTITC